MKRLGTALLAALMIAATLGAGGAQGAAKPLTVREFDPFWYLAAPRYAAPPAVGTEVPGCELRPGGNCRGFEFKPTKALFELSGVDLSGADLRRASLRPFLNDASLAGADLREANLNGTDAAALTAPFANFAKANVAGLQATVGRLADANFRGAEMYEAQLFAADLAGADLRGATLGRELAGAVLSGADLRGVNLREADLEFADLSHAKVSPGALKKASLCDTVLPSGKVANRRKRCELPPFYANSERQPTIQPSDPRYSLLIHAAGTWRNTHREKCGWVCPEGGQWLSHLRGPLLRLRAPRRHQPFRGQDDGAGQPDRREPRGSRPRTHRAAGRGRVVRRL